MASHWWNRGGVGGGHHNGGHYCILIPHFKYEDEQCTMVSISSGQRNLMKTYHNDANTSGITKIVLKKFLDFFWQRR